MKFNKIIAFLIFVTIGFQASGQDKTVKLPPNWYNLDFKKDGFFGISTEKAYSELLKGKQPKQKVIVAVIDGGTDVRHEDLKDVLWTNIKEIPGNGIDDDNNGYIDDVHGWNFIGSSKGNLAYDNLELVRIIRKLRPKYQSTLPSTRLDSAQKEEYELYQRATQEFGKKYDDAQRTMQYLEYITQLMDSVALQNKKTVPTMQDIENYKPDSEIESQILTIIKKESKNSGGFEKFYKEMKKGYKDYKVMLQYNLNPGYDERAQLVGDNYANSNERIYGNNDVAGPDADHGTHVSGIIGANRTNNIGINGIANSVLIMSIRVVPQGDERDKDVANGIRYAVDNGARVINMSFGKGFKWDKKVVDDAVRYAESKGVLLVHAAGNDNSNNDVVDNFPNKIYDSPEALEYQKKNPRKRTTALPMPGGPGMSPRPKMDDFVDPFKFKLPMASNWIEVGASSYKEDYLKADFSNYGKNVVDVFAPGFMINSTVPGSKYEEFDGTSMAAPVVSGLASLILSYYPEFTPAEVRDIIMKSSVKPTKKVKYEDANGQTVRSLLSEISVSGGIVNAYEALKMAETYKRNTK